MVSEETNFCRSSQVEMPQTLSGPEANLIQLQPWSRASVEQLFCCQARCAMDLRVAIATSQDALAAC